MTDRDFQLIKKNQISEKEKIKRADFLINTDKSLTETKKEVVQLQKQITGMLLIE